MNINMSIFTDLEQSDASVAMARKRLETAQMVEAVQHLATAIEATNKLCRERLFALAKTDDALQEAIDRLARGD